MVEPTTPLPEADVPAVLVDVAMRDAAPGCRDDARGYLANALPVFDQVIRAEIVRWIEAQMVKCPDHRDRNVGHRALCNWCWHNGALLGAARLARGDSGSTTAYALHRLAEQERVDA